MNRQQLDPKRMKPSPQKGPMRPSMYRRPVPPNLGKADPNSRAEARLQPQTLRFWSCAAIRTAATVLLWLTLSLQAALPTPLVDLRFSEASGTTTANAGSLGGSASLLQPDEYPLFTNNAPTGVYAPSGNTGSLDFGAIAEGQGGRAADLTATTGDGTLGALNAFTICGWLNARDLNEGWGGNRIAFALASPDGPGFDLVQLANGALRIGINQWPDGGGGGGPQSSAGMIKADPQTGAANWVFFTVTYDPSLAADHLKYYFGSPTTLASLDGAHDYTGGLPNGGLIESSGFLTVGNFSDVVGARNETGPNGGSRVIRGLIDELRIYDRALDVAEVQQAQLNGALPPVPVSITRQPTNQTVFVSQSVTFRVQVSGTAPFGYQWQRGTVDVEGATKNAYTLPAATLADNGVAFRVRVTNAVVPAGILSDPATLTVLADNNHKVSLSFSEGSGTTTANVGNIGGSATLVQANGLPVFSNAVPTGPFAPTANTSSIDFGVIADGEGGRAIDLTGAITPTLGSMTGFTVTGWLNCRDQQYGWGGNRILYCQASPGVGGFDLVQEAGGVLWVGVNQWPDGQPNSPAKSTGVLPADPDAGSANWVFFAFTYDGTTPTANANFYFGSPSQAAALDSTFDYDRGPIASLGKLTVGNFSSVDAGARTGTGNGGGSRVFRGLMDELNVFNKVLSQAEIQDAQKAPPGVPAVEKPTLTAGRQANEFVVSWDAATNFQLQYRTELGQGSWTDDNTPPTVNGTQKTVRLPLTGQGRFYRLISR